MRLFAEPECWAFKESFPETWAEFGCGPGGIGDVFVPDSILGLDVSEACRIHDWYYRLWEGETEEDRYYADRVGRNNTIRIIRHDFLYVHRYQWLFGARLWIARKAYLKVRRYGAPAFFGERNKPETYKEI
jgi:hypothetical protein